MDKSGLLGHYDSYARRQDPETEHNLSIHHFLLHPVLLGCAHLPECLSQRRLLSLDGWDSLGFVFKRGLSARRLVYSIPDCHAETVHVDFKFPITRRNIRSYAGLQADHNVSGRKNYSTADTSNLGVHASRSNVPTMKNQQATFHVAPISFRTNPKRTSVDAITSERITPAHHFFNADSLLGFEDSNSSEGFIIRFRRKAATPISFKPTKVMA